MTVRTFVGWFSVSGDLTTRSGSLSRSVCESTTSRGLTLPDTTSPICSPTSHGVFLITELSQRLVYHTSRTQCWKHDKSYIPTDIFRSEIPSVEVIVTLTNLLSSTKLLALPTSLKDLLTSTEGTIGVLALPIWRKDLLTSTEDTIVSYLVYFCIMCMCVFIYY